MVKMSFHFQVLFFHIHQKASKLGAIGNILDGSSYLASSLLLGENNWCFYLSSPSFNNAFFFYLFMIGDGWSRWYFHEEVRKAVVSDLIVYCLSCSQVTLQILIKNAYFLFILF